MRSRLTTLAAAIAVAATFGLTESRVHAQAPAADALGAARDLVVTMNMADRFKTMFPLMMRSIKPAIVQNRPQVEKDYDAIMPMMLELAVSRIDEAIEATAVIYANNFTASELRDVVAFYKTPTGRKFLEKAPEVMQQGMAAGQSWGQSMAKQLQEKIVNELRKRGHNI